MANSNSQQPPTSRLHYMQLFDQPLAAHLCLILMPLCGRFNRFAVFDLLAKSCFFITSFEVRFFKVFSGVNITSRRSIQTYLYIIRPSHLCFILMPLCGRFNRFPVFDLIIKVSLLHKFSGLVF